MPTPTIGSEASYVLNQDGNYSTAITDGFTYVTGSQPYYRRLIVKGEDGNYYAFENITDYINNTGPDIVISRISADLTSLTTVFTSPRNSGYAATWCAITTDGTIFLAARQHLRKVTGATTSAIISLPDAINSTNPYISLAKSAITAIGNTVYFKPDASWTGQYGKAVNTVLIYKCDSTANSATTVFSFARTGAGMNEAGSGSGDNLPMAYNYNNRYMLVVDNAASIYDVVGGGTTAYALSFLGDGDGGNYFRGAGAIAIDNLGGVYYARSGGISYYRPWNDTWGSSGNYGAEYPYVGSVSGGASGTMIFTPPTASKAANLACHNSSTSKFTTLTNNFRPTGIRNRHPVGADF